MVHTMERWHGKVVIVTGANAGIGAVIAEALVDAGLKVAGLDIQKEKMEEMANKLERKPGKLYPIITDVTQEEAILTAFKWVKENLGPIHILINNAGIAKHCPLLEGDTESWRKILETNILGVAIATREVVKDMRANNIDGHIINMNSISGHRIPNHGTFNLYPASKFAVTALTESLRQEFNSIGSKIKVTSISPGIVKDTDLFKKGLLIAKKHEIELVLKLPTLMAKDVADAVIYVLSTPPHVQVHEIIIQPVGEMM